MRFLLASLLMMSFSAFANDIINVIDGSAAYCKNKADVLKYESTAVYRPLEFVRSADEVTLKVEFLRCVQKGENFKFVRDTSFEERSVTVSSGPFTRDARNIVIKRSEASVVAFNTKGRVYFRGEMKKNADSTYSQTFPIELANFEANRNGDHFFEMAVSYKLNISDADTGVVIDSKLEYLGSYRVFVRD